MFYHTFMHHPIVQKLRTPGSASIGLLVLRLAAGAVFIYHGYMKFAGGLDGVVMFFSKLGIPAPGFFGPFVAGLELFGGILLILGVAVRLLGFMFAINMAVAFLTTWKMMPMWGKHELEFMMFASSLVLLLSGAGHCAIDSWCSKKAMKEHNDSMPVPPKM
jgi:putative oxidoreductase